jgi:HlyD family secretion protein
LSEDGGRPIAWIVNQGVAERRAVATGNDQDDDVLVTAGLEGGERVILNPPAELADGMAVKSLN